MSPAPRRSSVHRMTAPPVPSGAHRALLCAPGAVQIGLPLSCHVAREGEGVERRAAVTNANANMTRGVVGMMASGAAAALSRRSGPYAGATRAGHSNFDIYEQCCA